MGAFSDQQQLALEVTERFASILSLLGCAFVILTFSLSSRFRKPVNRLIFYAVWGNVLFNIATLISLSGVEAGVGSFLCTFQAFNIQAWLPADALWNLSLAINTYLTVFKHYDSERLKRLEPYYFAFNYLTPFIVALVYCFISTEQRGPLYASAVLWCWVSAKWEFLRLATCYVPAWICIIIAFCIYTSAGRKIFRKRRELRSFGIISQPQSSSADRGSVSSSSGAVGAFDGLKTTEISVSTSELRASSPSASPTRGLLRQGTSGGSSQAISPGADRQSLATIGYEPYSVVIGSSPRGSVATARPPLSSSSGLGNKLGSPSAWNIRPLSGQLHDGTTIRQRNTAMEANTAAWAYTKCCICFFISLLVTWVPSSVNRVYALANPSAPPNFSLAYVAAMVLPLTGFWNAVCYTVTSWSACRALFAEDIPNRLLPRLASVASLCCCCCCGGTVGSRQGLGRRSNIPTFVMTDDTTSFAAARAATNHGTNNSKDDVDTSRGREKNAEVMYWEHRPNFSRSTSCNDTSENRKSDEKAITREYNDDKGEARVAAAEKQARPSESESGTTRMTDSLDGYVKEV